MSGYADILRDVATKETTERAVTTEGLITAMHEFWEELQPLSDWCAGKSLVYDEASDLVGMLDTAEGWMTLVDDFPKYRGQDTVIIGDTLVRLVRLDPESPQMRAYHAHKHRRRRW